jgi:hypothetical protein
MLFCHHYYVLSFQKHKSFSRQFVNANLFPGNLIIKMIIVP